MNKFTKGINISSIFFSLTAITGMGVDPDGKKLSRSTHGTSSNGEESINKNTLIVSVKKSQQGSELVFVEKESGMNPKKHMKSGEKLHRSHKPKHWHDDCDSYKENKFHDKSRNRANRPVWNHRCKELTSRDRTLDRLPVQF
jgi:hypothetical protein